MPSQKYRTTEFVFQCKAAEIVNCELGVIFFYVSHCPFCHWWCGSSCSFQPLPKLFSSLCSVLMPLYHLHLYQVSVFVVLDTTVSLFKLPSATMLGCQCAEIPRAPANDHRVSKKIPASLGSILSPITHRIKKITIVFEYNLRSDHFLYLQITVYENQLLLLL